MRPISRLFSLLVLLAFPQVVRSESLLKQLPADGTWAKYHVTVRIGENEITRVWVIASVGRATIDGRVCRFLELREHSPDESVRYQVVKVAVPEKAFGSGENPFDSLRRVWVRRGEGEVRELSRLEEHDPGMAVVLAGPLKDLKKLDKEQRIQWQRGELQCDVFTGTSTLAAGRLKLAATHRVLVHEKPPSASPARRSTSPSPSATGNNRPASRWRCRTWARRPQARSRPCHSDEIE